MGISGGTVGGIIYPLRQIELDRITAYYKQGIPLSVVARKLHRSRTVIWQCYKKLRAGQTLTVSTLQPVRKKSRYRRKEEAPAAPKPKKPLVNPDRFYRSEFVPT